MNPLQKQPYKRSRAEIDAEIERIAREQGVKPYDPEENLNDTATDWTDEDEKDFEEFMQWRRAIRQADREAQNRLWQS